MEGVGYEARQTLNGQTISKDSYWYFHDYAQSFVLQVNTMHELRNRDVSVS